MHTIYIEQKAELKPYAYYIYRAKGRVKTLPVKIFEIRQSILKLITEKSIFYA
jgi:hypothetical protein